MTASRSNLIPQKITDRNGVITTRWVKPSVSLSTDASIPAPAVPCPVSPADEQKALYGELMEKLEGKDQFKTRIIRINNLHDQNWGQRALFRTFLKTLDARQPLSFIEDTHNLLVEYGYAETSGIIDSNTLDTTELIVRATGNHMIPPRHREESRPAREYIAYFLVSDDREALTRIINDRRPATLEELRALHIEFQRSSVPLQTGVL